MFGFSAFAVHPETWNPMWSVSRSELQVLKLFFTWFTPSYALIYSLPFEMWLYSFHKGLTSENNSSCYVTL